MKKSDPQVGELWFCRSCGYDYTVIVAGFLEPPEHRSVKIYVLAGPDFSRGDMFTLPHSCFREKLS